MDEKYMRLSLELAKNGIGRAKPNPLVGAVIVKNNVVIGEGYHEKYGYAHAEVNAIRNAIEKNPKENFIDSTIYVTLEPCSHYGKTPPCTDLIIEKGIQKVVIGMFDPNPLVAGRGVEKLRSKGIQVISGILEEECKKLNEVFIHYITTKTPYVVMKAAMSLDGKIATAAGESKWITSEASRYDVQILRGSLSSIMVGVNTVIKDNPELICRIEGGINPTRIIVDSKLRIPLESTVLKEQDKNQTIIGTTDQAPQERIKLLEEMGVKVILCKCQNNRVDLKDLMEKLGQINIDSILLEGGAILNDAAISDGIVQKIILYIAPKIIGGEESKTPVGGEGIASLAKAHYLIIDTIENIGSDIKIIAYFEGKEGFLCSQELLKK